MLGSCFMDLGVLSSLMIILLRKGYLVSFLYCVVVVCVLCLFLMVLWIGLQTVIVAIYSYTHSFFGAMGWAVNLVFQLTFSCIFTLFKFVI